MDKKVLRKRILQMSVPASMETVFQMMLGLIDSVFISSVGETALAGVTVTNQIVTLILLIFGTINVGGAILVAQYFGKGDKDKVSLYSGQLYIFGLAVGIITTAVMLIFYSDILKAMGAQDSVIKQAGIFFRISALSMPFSLLSTLTATILRAIGNTKTPMIANSIAVASNTGLNFLLIFGLWVFPKLGVAGAGYATLISRMISAGILMVYLFLFNKQIKFHIKHFLRIHLGPFRKLLTLSIPVTIGESAWAAGSFIYTVLYTRLGTSPLVASQLVTTIEEIFIMFSSGYVAAGLTFVGNDIGSRNFDGMRQKANEILKMGIGTSVVFGTLLAVFSRFIGYVYPTISVSIISMTAFALLFNSIFQPMKVINYILGNGVLKGGGDTKFVMITDCIAVFAVGIPSAFLLGYKANFGFTGIIVGRILEETARFILMASRYKSRKWYRYLAE